MVRNLPDLCFFTVQLKLRYFLCITISDDIVEESCIFLMEVLFNRLVSLVTGLSMTLLCLQMNRPTLVGSTTETISPGLRLNFSCVVFFSFHKQIIKLLHTSLTEQVWKRCTECTEHSDHANYTFPCTIIM